MAFQKIFIAGNVVAKPQLAKGSWGTAAHFAVSINRFSFEKGLWNQRVETHSILVWGKKAEICYKYLDNGFPIAIEGIFEHHHETRSLIIAADVHFLGLRTMSPEPPENSKNGEGY